MRWQGTAAWFSLGWAPAPPAPASASAISPVRARASCSAVTPAVTTGSFLQQVGGPYTLASFQDSYTLASAFPGDALVPNVIGQLNANAGSLTGTLDVVSPPTTAKPEGTPSQGALSANINSLTLNGRGVLATNFPTGFPQLLDFYIVSPA